MTKHKRRRADEIEVYRTLSRNNRHVRYDHHSVSGWCNECATGKYAAMYRTIFVPCGRKVNKRYRRELERELGSGSGSEA